jgi:hypothetical protein
VGCTPSSTPSSKSRSFSFIDAAFELVELQQFDGGRAMSLAWACRRHLHVRLDKSPQQSDWIARPLSAEQTSYAALDAHVLLALACATFRGRVSADTSGKQGASIVNRSPHSARYESATHLQQELWEMRGLARPDRLQTTVSMIAHPVTANRHFRSALRMETSAPVATNKGGPMMANLDVVAALEATGFTPTCFSIRQKGWLRTEHPWQRAAVHAKTIALVAGSN